MLNARGLELVFQQRQRIVDDLVEIHLGELGAAGAREIQQAVDDLRRAESLLRDLLEQRRLLCSSPCSCLASICAYEEMTASGVLTSCATPAASNPMDDILSDCES